jgi:ABC-type antimicrobial peptide transport system permease subunit
MALGAQRGEVLAMFLRQAGTIAGVGIAIGVLMSVIAGSLVDANIEGLRFDPRLLVLLGVAMFATTLLAAAIPARRAARIDPQQALREE